MLKLLTGLLPFVVYRIQGKSMLPTIHPGQKVLAQKIWFFCKVNRGDIVVCKDPRDGKTLIKRIKDYQPRTIGDVYYLVGDNEQGSTDSRHFGEITKSHILGKVFYIGKE